MKRAILLTIMAMNLALATTPHTLLPRPPILNVGKCETHSPQTFQVWIHLLTLALPWR
jgi:hypothetical protein